MWSVLITTHIHTLQCTPKRKLLVVMDMFIILIVVMSSWVYAHAQIHKSFILCIGCIWCIRSISIKLLKMKMSDRDFLNSFNIFLVYILKKKGHNVFLNFTCLEFQLDYGLSRYGAIIAMYNLVFKWQNMFWVPNNYLRILLTCILHKRLTSYFTCYGILGYESTWKIDAVVTKV